jgi:endo-1,4-beta-D-glucanase Y
MENGPGRTSPTRGPIFKTGPSAFDIPHMTRVRSRRSSATAVLGLLALVVVWSATGSAPAGASGSVARPFGSHPVPYAAGSVLPSDEVSRDAATRAFYDDWKATYLQQGCGKGRYFVNTHGDTNGRVVSEGQGYGMEIVPLMAGYDPDAQKEFNGLYRYVQDHPSSYSPRLMAWEQDHSCRNIGGVDSATDGDLSIAFGLLLADRQWGSAGAIDYLAEAKARISAIKKWEINHVTHLTDLGDWAHDAGRGYRFGTRTSDFMLDHFRAFKAATGDAFWGQVVRSTEKLVAHLRKRFAPHTGLLPDFVVDTDGRAKPAPPRYLESRNDGSYSWNACRVPWHLATDFLVSGSTRSRAAALKISSWVAKKTDGRPRAVRSGYSLDGSVLPHQWYELSFAAPFTVGASVDASQSAWEEALWNNITSKPASFDGYYGSTLKLQAMLVLSNNYWLP